METITEARISSYAEKLRAQERGEGTVGKYVRDLAAFAGWLGGSAPKPGSAAAWREELVRSGLAPATVNGKLAAVNGYFKLLGAADYTARPLRLQRRAFREQSRELTREEYGRLVANAKPRTALILETVCATGIRVSELPFITVEAALSGAAAVRLKGKTRTVLLPARLCEKLLAYAQKENTVSGEIFLTRNGNPLTRRQVWAEMKDVCGRAGVEPSKVFPHNLRHLFARTFYQSTGDIAKLADVLGHSSIDTTRIYLATTGAEHRRALDGLGLVS